MGAIPSDEYVAWVVRLKEQHPTARVYACYEAGPCGYWLHRELTKLGVTNYVVAAEVLGDARKQKTDNLDATALTDRLDRYVRGNPNAFTWRLRSMALSGTTKR